MIPLENSIVKKFGSHIMTVFCPNLCYNEVCYKGTAMYLGVTGDNFQIIYHFFL